jgi:oxygen-independent coproporphyrinogen-3 oxidase
VSVYGLTLHEGTPLWERHERGEVPLPGEETQRAEFLLARRRLTAAGLRHYEISNYARPGHESRHNSLYWTGGEYLGLGVAAHSFFDGVRRANPPDLAEYLRRVETGRPPADAEEPPSPRALAGERIMLALRQCDGVPVADLSRAIGQDFATAYGAEIARLAETGLLVCDGRRVALTEEGMLLSDRVFEEFF